MKRYGIYPNPVLDRVINARRGVDRGPSAEGPTAILTRVADRYDGICRRALPEFSPSEWMAIFDNLNGVALSDRITLTGIPAHVADAPELGDKWSVDHGNLVDQLEGLSFPELVAVADLTERFWARSDEFAGMDADQIIRALSKP